MKKIFLSKGKWTIVDDSDYAELTRYKWCLVNNKYAMRRIYGQPSRYVLMHRQILGLSDSMVHVDHVNRNTLDNRRKNLRVCTMSQNLCNSKVRCNNTSGYKGVSWDTTRHNWHAYINIGGHRVNLGRFDDLKEAVKVVKSARKALHKEFARNE